jgi:uncharacterized protein YndB with AHSA1/START domain
VDIIKKTIIVPYHKSKVYTYFIEPAKLSLWLCEAAEVEANEGGKYEIFWDKSNRRINNTKGCKILAMDYAHFLMCEWKGPLEFSKLMNNVIPLTQVTIFFKKHNETETEITLIHSGWKSSSQWKEARLWFERAWTVALENLIEILNCKDTGKRW